MSPKRNKDWLPFLNSFIFARMFLSKNEIFSSKTSRPPDKTHVALKQTEVSYLGLLGLCSIIATQIMKDEHLKAI